MSICDSPPDSVIVFRYYYYVELYSGVDLFSLIFTVTVTVRVRVSYRVRV